MNKHDSKNKDSRRNRNLRHNDRANMERDHLERDFRTKISIITFGKNDYDEFEIITVRFKLNKPMRAIDFYDILESKLKGCF